MSNPSAADRTRQTEDPREPNVVSRKGPPAICRVDGGSTFAVHCVTDLETVAVTGMADHLEEALAGPITQSDRATDRQAFPVPEGRA